MIMQKQQFFITSIILFLALTVSAQSESELTPNQLSIIDPSTPMKGAIYGLNSFSIQDDFNFVSGQNGQLTAGSDLMNTTIGTNGLFVQQFAQDPAQSSTFGVNNLSFNYNEIGNNFSDQWTISSFDEPTLTSRRSLGIYENFGDDFIVAEPVMYFKASEVLNGGAKVGVGTETPQEKLDVNGKLMVSANTDDEMVIINDHVYAHPQFNNPQDFGNGGGYFMMASKEGNFESAGIFGDGDGVTIWSPGDGQNGMQGYLFLLDEDRWGDDTNPYNDNGAATFSNALIAYVDGDGNWVVNTPPPAFANDINTEQKTRKTRLSTINTLETMSYMPTRDLKENEKKSQLVDVVDSPVLAINPMSLEQSIPSAVTKSPEGGYYVNYNQITTALVDAVQALTAENNDLKERINRLETKLEK